MFLKENRREVLWDDCLVDPEKTTAAVTLHRPERRETVLCLDTPCEGADYYGKGWMYFSVLNDNGLYRMYYLAMPQFSKDMTENKPPFRNVCYAESHDGIHWEKPSLGIFEYEGSKDNNIVWTDTRDTLHVFRDDNPACPENMRYKGVYSATGVNSKSALYCAVSADGVHFEPHGMITEDGSFDSQNTGMWDANSGKYLAWFRDFHPIRWKGTRDIRFIESDDFEHWSEPVMLNYTNTENDFHIYTNAITKLPRAEHIFVGFPVRYTERGEWTDSFEKLPYKKDRLFRMNFQKRFGLAVTDGLFMFSRDGKNFVRFDDAYLTPDAGWAYGDCYVAAGILPLSDGLSLYVPEGAWRDEPLKLVRYRIRPEGFVSRRGSINGAKLVTKPFTFSGDALSVNFKTSAAGGVKIKLICGDETDESIELFGDDTDRKVVFERPIGEFAGKEVRLEFDLKDADVYSLVFCKEQ